MDARDIIKRPVVTEESTSILDDKKYTFEVDHSSTASHPEVIRTFLANHIPVYVDKPIADNLAEVEE